MPYKMTKPPKSMLGSPKKLSADSERKKIDSATQAAKSKSNIKSNMTGGVGPKLKKDTPKAKGGMKKNLPAYPGMSTGKLTKGPNGLGKNRKTPPGKMVKV